MEPLNHERSGRSIFELGEIRGSAWGSGRPARNTSSERSHEPNERPVEARLKNVPMTDRQLSLSIGAIEHAMIELRRLPGTEQAIKEMDGCLYTLRQALAVLPAGGPR